MNSMRSARWLYPIAGGILGFLYVVLDEGILDHISSKAAAVIVVHEFLDAIFPILFGIAAGAGFYFLKRRRQLIGKLSLKNESLQNDLLFHTLISQMLHEIRNPLHAILAALENSDTLTAAEQKELILRNLGRFNEIRKLYEEKDSLIDRLDPREPLAVHRWLPGLIEDKVLSRFRELRIQLFRSIEPCEIRMHPLLLEQVLLTLFSNAADASSGAPAGSRSVRLSVGPASDAGKIEIVMSNTGALFPDDVLESQGRRPSKSEKGHGLGLLLARKLLEQAGGTFEVRNRNGHAEAVIGIPGKRL